MARPELVCLADFEKYACKVLPKNAIDYYRSGADGEITLYDNVKALSRWYMISINHYYYYIPTVTKLLRIDLVDLYIIY